MEAGLALPGHAPIHDPALAEIVRRLVEAFQPERIYLFGSKARGDAGPDSDYDLMVIVPDDAPPERRRSRLAYQRLWGTGTAADVLVWTKECFDSRRHLQASLPATILREGRVLYAG
ncbi:MAG TPA: nucleotidyltransferase domain-containing protein [Chloroflexota bacterium]|jgi:predicted nucleotidyltransferase|nr:nucleotidyltransferase domain-containing protein [Chloroflexota bacterium]